MNELFNKPTLYERLINPILILMVLIYANYIYPENNVQDTTKTIYLLLSYIMGIDWMIERRNLYISRLYHQKNIVDIPYSHLHKFLWLLSTSKYFDTIIAPTIEGVITDYQYKQSFGLPWYQKFLAWFSGLVTILFASVNGELIKLIQNILQKKV